MEFVQGCFNGLIIGGAFALGWPLAAENLAEAEASGKLWCGLPPTVEAVLPWVFCALIICIAFLFTSKKFSKYTSLESMRISWLEITMPLCSMCRIISKWIISAL